MSHISAIAETLSESARLFELFTRTSVEERPIPKFNCIIQQRQFDLGFGEASKVRAGVDPFMVLTTMGEILVGQGFTEKKNYTLFDAKTDFNFGFTQGWDKVTSFSVAFHDKAQALLVKVPKTQEVAAAFFRAAEKWDCAIDVATLPDDPAILMAYNLAFKPN